MLFLKSPPTPSHTFAFRGRQSFPKAFFSSPLRGSLIPQPLDNRRVPEKGCSWGSWGLQEPASPVPSGNLASGVPSLREMSQSRAGRQAPPRCAPGGGLWARREAHLAGREPSSGCAFLPCVSAHKRKVTLTEWPEPLFPKQLFYSRG